MAVIELKRAATRFALVHTANDVDPWATATTSAALPVLKRDTAEVIRKHKAGVTRRGWVKVGQETQLARFRGPEGRWLEQVNLQPRRDVLDMILAFWKDRVELDHIEKIPDGCIPKTQKLLLQPSMEFGARDGSP